MPLIKITESVLCVKNNLAFCSVRGFNGVGAYAVELLKRNNPTASSIPRRSPLKSVE